MTADFGILLLSHTALRSKGISKKICITQSSRIDSLGFSQGQFCVPYTSPSQNVVNSCPWMLRLLHSPNLFTVGQSVYGKFKNMLRIPTSPMHFSWLTMHYGFMWLVGIQTILKGYWQSLCTALMAGNLPAIRAVQGDCETVYQKLTMDIYQSYVGSWHGSYQTHTALQW